MNQMFWFEQAITRPRAASHRGVAIKYIDISCMESAFINELKSTTINWVYSNEKYSKLLKSETIKRNGNTANASSYIQQIVNSKFRNGYPHGQFGELLLFNFLQHFFKAVPLLRKMPITTNPQLERNGADAIHYTETKSSNTFFIGESKCYESKYKFNEALKDSIDSIVKTFNNIQNELNLYQYDDFIDSTLQSVATNLKDGKLLNPRFELVCLITYEETQKVDIPPASEIEKNIQDCIKTRWDSTPLNIYDEVSSLIIERIHYIIFPSWNLGKLLDHI